MSNGFFRVPQPYNEPVKAYLPGSPERAALKAELARQSGEVVDIPLIIGGKEIWTERRYDVVMPHERAHVIARCCVAGEAELRMAAEAACRAAKTWGAMPFEQRAAVFLKAAELLSGPWRAKLNASTMLGQSKTAYQAEIDAVCELCDFFRYNAHFAAGIYERQPENARGVWNRVEYRPLDGFVLAVTPFNFTSIGGNLPGAPALMGNCVVWKPASAAALSNYYVMRLLMEAGLPEGVINFVPARGAEVSRVLIADPRMAGFHFTGSTEVFSGVWSAVGANISNYRSYPRLVGETGGKDFVFAHASADADALAAALVRGAYEYQGQKCSAASRAYIPASLWESVKQKMLALIAPLKVGDVADFTNFMGAVIDEASFGKITSYIDMAKASPDAEFICGGYDGAKGYFIRPTLIRAKTPDFPTMTTELFGPVLTVYVYEDAALEQTLALCDTSTAYALTGAIFANDRAAILRMEAALRDAAGNFYINDKPTGAVVGQQPFGGARASGTNDKAGSELNLIRWVSPRTIKETFVPATAADYPYMSEA
ncbi:MAG: 1-pyrroline-5-carboxylate dehydrogenase 1 [Firmicutes bacterium ADurb.Bin248]|nr:MAG: 1-pyrroline-5-carboxylate dehydrogenase 1 [Firmicutes bacterium ADurb.Bin248]HOF99589.1 L-glutamate gamma-semialdehyde dehydrogenase [Clostridia bacterium]